ncbi:MAG: membrane protein insertase YidC [Clostridia bacterium]|nr:membrane protein insertase YidC [Clostridia bacterium]
MSFISIPMGHVLSWISSLVGNNFAAAVCIFTILVNILMLPLTMKSQKSTVQQTRIKPKLDALKAKCGNDKQKYSREMQELYQREGVSMSGGCMPLILRMVLMMGIYWAITNPLRYLCGIDAGAIKDAMSSLEIKNAMELVPLAQAGELSSFGISAAKAQMIDFNLFGINLLDDPVFTKPDWIWVMPIMSFVAQMASSFVTMKINKRNNPDAPSMAGMMFTMPFISLWIGFSFPGALGFYWAVSAIAGGAAQAFVSLKYGPDVIIAKEQSKETYARFKYEKNRKKTAQ